MSRVFSGRRKAVARRSRLWRVLIAVSTGIALAGCGSLGVRSSGHASTPGLQIAPQPRVTLMQSAVRIVQQRAGGAATFVLGADEPQPTPKTLAGVGQPVSPEVAQVSVSARHTAITQTPQANPPRAVPARVREPIGSVYFASAASRVDPAALPIVAAAAGRVARADRVVLTAYTDPYGTQDENRRLAERRAESVTAVLADRGVDRAHVVVLSRPQCCARQPLPERDAAPYRRVDIEILTHGLVRSEASPHDPQQHS